MWALKGVQFEHAAHIFHVMKLHKHIFHVMKLHKQATPNTTEKKDFEHISTY